MISFTYGLSTLVQGALLLMLNTEIWDEESGQSVLQEKINITVACQRGWTGENCDGCIQGWAGENCDGCIQGWAGENCDACAPGWIGENCDVCERFGFSTESNCTECIQNGLWVGRERSNDVEVYFTFTGPSCSELVTGK